MATISSAGIGSGLDVNGIVTQLMAVEKQPLQSLQKSASKLQTQISAYGQIQSQLSALSDAATQLGSAASWDSAQATSSDATSVSASVTSSSLVQAGTLSVQVQRLATAQSTASAPLSASQNVGTGKLTLQLGSWNAAGDQFTASGSPVEIDLTSGSTTPADIAAKINAAGAGVTATTLTDASGTRLVLTSSATGQANGFTVSTDAQGASSGLGSLVFEPGSGSGAMQRVQTAQDAQATINGVTITSASNKLDSTLPGLSLTLAKTTTSAVTLTVAPDTTARRALIDKFVSTYNTLSKTLATTTAYDATTKAAGTLQGDRTVASLQSALRSVISAVLPSGTYTRLLDVGLSQQRDGTLGVDESKLAAAMSKGADLGALFNAAGTTGVSDGLAKRLGVLATGMTAVDGLLTTRTSALQSAVKRNGTDQDRLNDRLSLTEKRLRTQYTALDGSMSRLNALNNYVSQQVSQWNKASGGG